MLCIVVLDFIDRLCCVEWVIVVVCWGSNVVEQFDVMLLGVIIEQEWFVYWLIVVNDFCGGFKKCKGM